MEAIAWYAAAAGLSNVAYTFPPSQHAQGIFRDFAGSEARLNDLKSYSFAMFLETAGSRQEA